MRRIVPRRIFPDRVLGRFPGVKTHFSLIARVTSGEEILIARPAGRAPPSLGNERGAGRPPAPLIDFLEVTVNPDDPLAVEVVHGPAEPEAEDPDADPVHLPPALEHVMEVAQGEGPG